MAENVIKKNQKLLPSKWWYVGAAVVALLAVLAADYAGWQGWLLLVYSVLILLVGRGKKINKETRVQLDNR